MTRTDPFREARVCATQPRAVRCRTQAALWILCGVVCVGCGETAPPHPAAGGAAPQNAGGGPPAALVAAPPQDPVEHKASEDYTKKGMKGAELGSGLVSTPAAVYLRIPDRLVFDQVHHALDLYRASNGELPKTHDDFMREIIEANNLKLPELPEGSRYVYRPQEGELMIEVPPKP